MTNVDVEKAAQFGPRGLGPLFETELSTATRIERRFPEELVLSTGDLLRQISLAGDTPLSKAAILFQDLLGNTPNLRVQIRSDSEIRSAETLRVDMRRMRSIVDTGIEDESVTSKRASALAGLSRVTDGHIDPLNHDIADSEFAKIDVIVRPPAPKNPKQLREEGLGIWLPLEHWSPQRMLRVARFAGIVANVYDGKLYAEPLLEGDNGILGLIPEGYSVIDQADNHYNYFYERVAAQVDRSN